MCGLQNMLLSVHKHHSTIVITDCCMGRVGGGQLFGGSNCQHNHLDDGGARVASFTNGEKETLVTDCFKSLLR